MIVSRKRNASIGHGMMLAERNSPQTIYVGERLRALNEAAVCRLVESIKLIGLQTPISIRYAPDEDGDQRPVLVAGRHRLEACLRLGIDFVDCIIHEDEAAARLWEIAENLHRSDLTALEHDQHVAEWIRLTEVSAQSAPKPKGGRPESGIRAASRQLGIDRDAARRAVKVDSLSDEAKQAARETGLDDNRTVLIEVAKQTTKEGQLRRLREKAALRADRKEAARQENRSATQCPPDQLAEASAMERRVSAAQVSQPASECDPKTEAADLPAATLAHSALKADGDEQEWWHALLGVWGRGRPPWRRHAKIMIGDL